MLSERFPLSALPHLLQPQEGWRPFPPCSDRPAWEALPAAVRAELVRAGEAALAAPWPTVPASAYLEFVRSGNRRACEERSFPRRTILAHLVLAEAVEDQGRFLAACVDAAWSLCEESSWCISAHIGAQKAGAGLPDTQEPIVDLFAAETAALMAWTVYLLRDRFDQVSRLIVPRILSELATRMLTPCLTRADFWWMGADPRRALNNWTPWICSNWLATALLAETDPERRLAAVSKSMVVLDRFLAQQQPDGGCDEGPGYWNRAGASVFDCLDLLYRASGGAIDLYGEALVRQLGAYIHRVHIAADWFVNFADGGARLRPDPGLLWRFGRACGDPDLVALGRLFAAQPSVEKASPLVSLSRLLADLFDPIPSTPAAAAPPARDVWLPDLQVMAARCAPAREAGFFVAAKGGHNAESHNHNDVGNVIIFLDGRPVLIDPGVETYTAKTFSAQRYELWTMQSAFHNLPTFGPFQQRPGGQARAVDVAYEQDDREARFSLDLAAAYPPAAGVRQCRRTVVLRRGLEVEIADTASLEHPLPFRLSLMTPCAVEPLAAGTLALRAREGSDAGRVRAVLRATAAELTVTGEAVDTSDPRLHSVWSAGLNRILLCWPAALSRHVQVRLARPEEAL